MKKKEDLSMKKGILRKLLPMLLAFALVFTMAYVPGRAATDLSQEENYEEQDYREPDIDYDEDDVGDDEDQYIEDDEIEDITGDEDIDDSNEDDIDVNENDTEAEEDTEADAELQEEAEQGYDKIFVTKVWDVPDGYDALILDEITLTLYEDGEEYNSVTLSKEDFGGDKSWSSEILAKEGKKIDPTNHAYELKETSNGEDIKNLGFSNSIDFEGSAATITNTCRQPEGYKSLKIIKTWDCDPADIPDGITFRLTYDSPATGGEIELKYELNKSDYAEGAKEWVVEKKPSKNMPLPKDAVYKLEEECDEIFETTGLDQLIDNGDGTAQFEVTNFLKDITPVDPEPDPDPGYDAITIVKEWDCKLKEIPDSVDFTLTFEVDGYAPVTDTITMTKDDNRDDDGNVRDTWIAEFHPQEAASFPKNAKYTLEEEKVEGFSTKISKFNKKEGVFNVINTKNRKGGKLLSWIPKTGDNNNIFLLVGALLVAVICIIGAIVFKMKRK